MPVVSRDLSSHSWGSIAIGQHHAIGQVGKYCLGSSIFADPNQSSATTRDISVQEKDGRVLALGRSEYGRLGLGDGEKRTYSIDANMILS